MEAKEREKKSFVKFNTPCVQKSSKIRVNVQRQKIIDPAKYYQK